MVFVKNELRFDERGLIRLRQTTDHLQMDLNEVEGKVNLEDSQILKRLRALTEQ